jgi:hypothetical protein
MSNGMSPRIRHLVSGLAAIATTGLLVSTLVNAFDTRLILSPSVNAPDTVATASIRRDADVRKG